MGKRKDRRDYRRTRRSFMKHTRRVARKWNLNPRRGGGVKSKCWLPLLLIPLIIVSLALVIFNPGSVPNDPIPWTQIGGMPDEWEITAKYENGTYFDGTFELLYVRDPLGSGTGVFNMKYLPEFNPKPSGSYLQSYMAGTLAEIVDGDPVFPHLGTDRSVLFTYTIHIERNGRPLEFEVLWMMSPLQIDDQYAYTIGASMFRY